MKLLLDTHVLLWWVSGHRKLSGSLSKQIGAADNEISVSAATFWELAIKIRLGRIRIELDELRAAIKDDGFTELPVQIAHTLRLLSLPDFHRDPFDRLLIAQSISEGQRLVTGDEAILAYAGQAGFDPLIA
ncbi:MAG TPA: type II toxin-antitoxin system VapC family toxin [Thermoanaerobaculia bacterium]|nr:type II toxin-antitoxin system VapC family toxin [Thermoanaerobaculia bacterium]